MNPKLSLTIQFLLTLILAALCLYLGTLIAGTPFNIFAGTAKAETTGAATCTNMSLPDAARCYQDYIGTFYNYTQRSDTDKTLDDVKQNGGDCYDYSLLYVKMAQGDGLTAQQAVFPIGNASYHAVAIISDDKYGYCILDQLVTPFCVPLDFGYNLTEEAQDDWTPF